MRFPAKGQSFVVDEGGVVLSVTGSRHSLHDNYKTSRIWGSLLGFGALQWAGDWTFMFPLKSVSLLCTVQNQPGPWRAWAQRLDCCVSNDVRSEHMCSTLSHVSTCKPHTCQEGMNPKHDSWKDISETLSSDITFLFYYEFGKKRQSSNPWRLTLVMNERTLFYYNVD